MVFFIEDFFYFFIEFVFNNNKDWFDLNRKCYELFVKKIFVGFVEYMIWKFVVYDFFFKELILFDCVFWINRDICFFRDKIFYKLNCLVVLVLSGKKSFVVNGIYFEFGLEVVNVYGGVYEVDKDQVMDICEGIVVNQKEFSKFIVQFVFQELFGEILGEKNKIIFVDLKEVVLKQLFIYNKQWYFKVFFEFEILLSDQFDEIFENCYFIVWLIEDFFNKFIYCI